MANRHGGLAAGGWQKLSLAAQLGNIGAEVGRALRARVKGQAEQEQLALERGLELFDLTIADSRWHGRLKELLRAREVVCDYFFGDNHYRSQPDQIETYFMQFALAARLSL